MESNKDKLCNTCKYGYFRDFSVDGNHNLCGAGLCYLCRGSHSQCGSYEQGEPPEDSEPM